MQRKIASFIVNKRRFILVAALLLAFASLFTISRVNINYDFTSYLSRETRTRKSLELMQSEFGTTETLSILLTDAPQGSAERLCAEMNDKPEVLAASFDAEKDRKTVDGTKYERISLLLDDVDAIAFYRTLDESLSARGDLGRVSMSGSAPQSVKLENKIGSEIPIAMLIAVIVVLLVLELTSHSYFEPVVFMLVLIVSILINMGTNFIFGSISFITFAVCAILQLALAMDYSIMLLHSYFEIRETQENDSQALILALERTFMPIGSSALTTVSSLVSLMFMSFTIGFDIGIVLSKGILITMISVFTLMPALIMLFSKPLAAARHKPLNLGGRRLGAFMGKKAARIVFPAVLIALIVVSAFLCGRISYTFTDTGMNSDADPVNQVFGASNNIVVLLPSDGSREQYERQRAFVREAEKLTYDGKPVLENVLSIVTTGDAAIRVFSAEEAYALITSLAGENSFPITAEAFAGLMKSSGYEDGITMRELVNAARDMAPLLGRFGIGEEELKALTEGEKQLDLAEKMFLSPRYSRLILTFNAPLQGEESEKLLTDTMAILQRLYPDETTGLTGLMMSVYDISHAFHSDLTRVSLITIIAIFLIVMISFRSLIVPVVLLCVIQGAVWVNFALSVPAKIDVFFMCYLICLAIQMGATIDYGILLSSHYVRLRQTLAPGEALKEAMQLSLPAILTSGLILVGAGYIIGRVCTIYYIYAIGLLIASGAVFSLIMVLFLLPAMLINLDRWIIRRKKV